MQISARNAVATALMVFTVMATLKLVAMKYPDNQLAQAFLSLT